MPNPHIRELIKQKKFLDDVKSGKIKLTDSEEDRDRWWTAARKVYGFA